MELNVAIAKRRSIRNFSSKEVSRQQIEEIIAAGSRAPSACDYQAWRFIIIDDFSLKQRIVDAGGASFIKKSPVGILVVYDNRTDNLEYRDYIQSAAAAIQNMLLTATSLGIGSCWVCHLPPKSVFRKLFKIPAYFDPIAYVALGYSESEIKEKEIRKPVNDIVSLNEFIFKDNVTFGVKFKFRRIIRNLYLHFPLFLKKRLRRFAERFVKKFDHKK